MNECRCTKVKEIATMETEIRTLFKLVDINKNELGELNKVYDLLYGITTNVSVLTEQMINNTNQLSKVSKDVETIKTTPSDYNYYKRQSEKMDHYKKVAIGVIITGMITAFMAGKLI